MKIADIETLLADIIRFVSISDVEDPLEREGVPIKANQNIVVDLVSRNICLC